MRSYSILHLLIGVFVGFNFVMLFADHIIPPTRDFVLAPFGFHDTGRILMFVACLGLFGWPLLSGRGKGSVATVVITGTCLWLLGMMGMALLGVITMLIKLFALPFPFPDTSLLSGMAGLAVMFLIVSMCIFLASRWVLPIHVDAPPGNMPASGRGRRARADAPGNFYSSSDTSGDTGSHSGNHSSSDSGGDCSSDSGGGDCSSSD